MKYITITMFLLAYASVGGVEMGQISLVRGFVQTLVFMLLMVISYKAERKIGQRKRAARTHNAYSSRQ
ncbi:MAG: hypothetical protein RR198_08295 [Oscillospiraceae bacterium]